MITASHNENGWTGIKMGIEKGLTHCKEEMSELKDIVLSEKFTSGKFTYKSIKDFNKIYTTSELASGDVMFSATGVTDGTMLKGVRIKNNIARTESVVIRSKTKTVRYITAEHDLNKKKILF